MVATNIAPEHNPYFTNRVTLADENKPDGFLARYHTKQREKQHTRSSRIFVMIISRPERSAATDGRHIKFDKNRNFVKLGTD